MASLAGSRILVIGGTSGIGLGVARAAMAEGAQVTVASSNQDRVDPPEIQMEDAMFGWLQLDHIERPDADVYMATLIRALVAAGEQGPLLCLDLFPGNARSVFIATSDAHWAGAGLLEGLLRRFEAAQAHVTVYYEPPQTPTWRRYARRARWAAGQWPLVGSSVRSEFAPPSPALVREWRARGHEFVPHPVVADGLYRGLDHVWQSFADDGYGIEASTVRTHSVLWTGWVETSRALRERGVRMSLDAYATGLGLRRRDGSFAHGHLIGSGLPARFVDERGALIDSFEQPTQLVDEQLLGVAGGMENLTGVQAADVLAGLLDRALATWPAAIAGIFHADNFAPGLGGETEAGAFIEHSMALCRQRGVPVLTAGAWLKFVDARRAVEAVSRSWDAGTGRLSCTVEVPATIGPGVGVLLPPTCRGAGLRDVRIDGAPVTPEPFSRAGQTWARVLAHPGTVRLELTYATT